MQIVEGSDLDTANRTALPTTQTELSDVETGIVSTVNINGKAEKNATDPVMEVIEGTEEDDDDAPSEDFHVEEFGEEAGHILIPASGEQQSNKPNELRHVPNGCSVCLSPFAVGESITWSSNSECKHAFHHSCILDWFKASGRRQCRRRRLEQSEGMLNYANDPLLKITNFRMECPCCRQVFISTKTAQSGEVPTFSSEVASTVDSDENSSVSERSSTNLSSNEDPSSGIQPREDDSVDTSNEDNV